MTVVSLIAFGLNHVLLKDSIAKPEVRNKLLEKIAIDAKPSHSKLAKLSLSKDGDDVVNIKDNNGLSSSDVNTGVEGVADCSRSDDGSRSCQEVTRSAKKLPLVALAAAPGSGSSWAKHLLQQATGRDSNLNIKTIGP